MEVRCQLDERGCKLHIDVAIVLIWCHIKSFATKLLCNLSKVIKGIFYHMCHLWPKNKIK
jgi:hypothetical protein